MRKTIGILFFNCYDFSKRKNAFRSKKAEKAFILFSRIANKKGFDVVFSDTKQYKDKKVFILHPLDKDDYGPHKEIKFSLEDYRLIKERDEWELYFTESFFDTINLVFKNNYLIEIYRHRKKFELP